MVTRCLICLGFASILLLFLEQRLSSCMNSAHHCKSTKPKHHGTRSSWASNPCFNLDVNKETYHRSHRFNQCITVNCVHLSPCYGFTGCICWGCTAAAAQMPSPATPSIHWVGNNLFVFEPHPIKFGIRVILIDNHTRVAWMLFSIIVVGLSDSPT